MKILRRYKYDPLDRLAGLQAQEQTFTQRFYQENDLVTELGEEDQQTIFRHGEQPLGQRQTLAGATDTLLLATDQAHSVLQTLSATRRERMAYSAYGHRPAESGLSSLLGFNGECLDGITGHYLLGQGKRVFNPVLMRFNSPDELSPFGDGGINSYAYCENDPINFSDPSGSSRIRMLLGHRPIIVKNPLYRASVITKNPFNNINPTATTIQKTKKAPPNAWSNHLSKQSTSKEPPGSNHGISRLGSQPEEFEHELPINLVYKSKKPETQYQRELAYGIKYDNLKVADKNFKTYVTPRLRIRYNQLSNKIDNFHTSNRKRHELEDLKTYRKKTFLAIKRYSVEIHEKTKNPAQQIRN